MNRRGLLSLIGLAPVAGAVSAIEGTRPLAGVLSRLGQGAIFSSTPGNILRAGFGGTIIDGSRISVGTITASRIASVSLAGLDPPRISRLAALVESLGGGSQEPPSSVLDQSVSGALSLGG